MRYRRWLLLGLLLLAGSATGLAAPEGTCRLELSQLASGLPADMPAGTFAAQLLAGAVELVEPALPAWRGNMRIPLEQNQAGYGAVSYLVARDLLPDSWRAAELTPAVWQDMLGRFLDWYALTLPPLPASASGSLTREQIVTDLIEALGLVAGAVRPVAIIASDSGVDVAFLALLWNWTVYPRLLVWRGDALSLAEGPENLLPTVSTCAVQVERYVLAPVQTAWQLFTGTGGATMYILGSEPSRRNWPLPVAQDDVLEYLQFEPVEVRGLNVFAAVFDGQELGVGAILRLVRQVRTNVAPAGILGFLSSPVP